jgi:hypothetical protein
MKTLIFVRFLKDGKIRELPIQIPEDSRIFDIVFKTENGNINVDAIKDGNLRIHVERRMVVYPEAANAVTLKSIR